MTILPDGIAGTAAQKCREWGGCWECQIFSPRLPKVLTKIVQIATEIANRHCRDCRDCWDCRECRYLQDCRDRRDSRPRLPGLPILPDENGWLHAEIEKIPEVAGGIAGTRETAAQKCRDCRGCWACRIFSRRLPKVLAKIVEIATEIAGRHWRDCKGCWECRECRYFRDCRDCRGYRYVQPRMGDCTLRLKKLTSLPDGIAGTAEFDSQKCWDCRGCWEWWKGRTCRQRLPRMSANLVETAAVAGLAKNADNGKIAKIAETVARDCGDSRFCLPRRGDCTSRLKKLTSLPDGTSGTAEVVAQKCRDSTGCWECRIFSPRLPKVMTKIVEIATEIAGRQCRDGRDCWECRECRHCQDCRDRQECLLRMPVLPILLAENGWLHAEIEKIDEIAGRDCRDCRGCLPKMPRLAGLLRVMRLPNLQTESAKIAMEIVGRHSRDCRDCWDCRECRYWQVCRDRRDCRPRLPGLPTLPAENGWLHAETEKNDEAARRD